MALAFYHEVKQTERSRTITLNIYVRSRVSCFSLQYCWQLICGKKEYSDSSATQPDYLEKKSNKNPSMKKPLPGKESSVEEEHSISKLV